MKITTMINSPGPLASKAEWAAHLMSLETLAEAGQVVADLIMVAKSARQERLPPNNWSRASAAIVPWRPSLY
jgi:hypothetical protein